MAEAIRRLASRAATTDQLISALRTQIRELSTNASGEGAGCPYQTFEAEIASLRKENDALRKQIDDQKEALVKAEVANGVPQVKAPAASKGAPSGAGGDEVVAPKQPSDAQVDAKKEKPKKEKKEGGKKKQDQDLPVHVGSLDMRIGLIRSAKKHPDADSLYVEEVDVGEEKPRTVISGLVKFIPLEEMQNRKAIMLCNLKPSKMRGIMSEAMVMCASTPEKVEILSPPEDAVPGDLVSVPGFPRLATAESQLNPKKKIFETCAPDLRVNSDGVATFKGVPWAVNGKPCTARSLRDVQIK